MGSLSLKSLCFIHTTHIPTLQLQSASSAKELYVKPLFLLTRRHRQCHFKTWDGPRLAVATVALRTLQNYRLVHLQFRQEGMR
jgi:hypothetical protein